MTTPAIGQRWRMKHRRDRGATVAYVHLRPDSVFGGYVQLDAPWISRHRGKSLDTFLKQYEPAPDAGNPSKPLPGA